MSPEEKRRHTEAQKILLKRTCQDLECDPVKVFEFAGAVTQLKDWEGAYQKYLSTREIPTEVEDLCLDVLSRRIVPLITPSVDYDEMLKDYCRRAGVRQQSVFICSYDDAQRAVSEFQKWRKGHPLPQPVREFLEEQCN